MIISIAITDDILDVKSPNSMGGHEAYQRNQGVKQSVIIKYKNAQSSTKSA